MAFLSMRAIRVRPYHNAAKPSVETWYDIELALRLMQETASSVTSATAGVEPLEPILDGRPSHGRGSAEQNLAKPER